MDYSAYHTTATVLSSASRDTPVHPASLIPVAHSDPRVLDLMEMPVTWDLVDYVIDFVTKTVAREMNKPGVSEQSLKTAFLVHTLSQLLSQSLTTTAHILVALVYFERICDTVALVVPDMFCERVFLGCLILATKYTNENSWKLRDWAQCSGIYQAEHVRSIEMYALRMLHYSLRIEEADLLKHYAGVMARCVQAPGYYMSLSVGTIGPAAYAEWPPVAPDAPEQPPAPLLSPASPDLTHVRSASSSPADSIELETPGRAAYAPVQNPFVASADNAPRPHYYFDPWVPSPKRHSPIPFIPPSPQPAPVQEVEFLDYAMDIDGCLLDAFEALRPEYRPRSYGKPMKSLAPMQEGALVTQQSLPPIRDVLPAWVWG